MQFTSDIDETGQGTRSSQFAADPLMPERTDGAADLSAVSALYCRASDRECGRHYPARALGVGHL